MKKVSGEHKDIQSSREIRKGAEPSPLRWYLKGEGKPRRGELRQSKHCKLLIKAASGNTEAC